MEPNAYQKQLAAALELRRSWLEKNELPRLKDGFRAFHLASLGLYRLLLKKGLIHEDPYKEEAKIGGIEIPSTEPFSEGEQKEQMSRRLAAYDNQLDFLVNFSPFSIEFFSLENIKKVLALLKYIDWPRLKSDSLSVNTRATADFLSQIRTGGDRIAAAGVNDFLGELSKAAALVMGPLRELADFHRERYKLMVRLAITSKLEAPESSAAQIRKRFPADLPRTPFYPDLVEELLKEDYAEDGGALRERVLKSLDIPEKKEEEKAPVSFKPLLIEGLLAVGSLALTLGEMGPKLDENDGLLANRKKRLWQKLKLLLDQMMKKEPEPTVYTVEYPDPSKGIPVKEDVNYREFRRALDRKAQALARIFRSGPGRLKGMEEERLLVLLDRSIRDTLGLHKTLSALDDFFKLEASSQDERDRVKGIKPELAAMKNALIRATQKRDEYRAEVEEAEQLRRLGISL